MLDDRSSKNKQNYGADVKKYLFAQKHNNQYDKKATN